MPHCASRSVCIKKLKIKSNWSKVWEKKREKIKQKKSTNQYSMTKWKSKKKAEKKRTENEHWAQIDTHFVSLHFSSSGLTFGFHYNCTKSIEFVNNRTCPVYTIFFFHLTFWRKWGEKNGKKSYYMSKFFLPLFLLACFFFFFLSLFHKF